jgi:protein-S-isoprenylcysteine O-methyltransferase Ste14
MPSGDFFVNRAVVLASALLYWGGVYFQARRIRRRIGRPPNVKPRGTKERILWAGWFLVVIAWLTLPFLAGTGTSSLWRRLIPSLCGVFGLFCGIVLTGAGYAGTLWCYAVMGNTWRMGVNRAEKTLLVTSGPFRFVRHPIYLFQVFMLTGTALLLPTPISLTVLGIHLICIMAKAADEEEYLRTVHGGAYGNYLSRTGRFFPRLRSRWKL